MSKANIDKLTQQTRDAMPMSAQCLASVEDDGPALHQHQPDELLQSLLNP